MSVHRMDLNEYLTWSEHGAALEKWAAILQSIVWDAATQTPVKPTWGEPSRAIGAFLAAVAATLKAQGDRAEERRERKEEQQEAAEQERDHRWEVDFLNAFYAEAFGSGLGDRNYGRDRRVLRAYHQRNPDVEPATLEELIPHFFAPTTHPVVRGDGSVGQFLRRLGDLSRLHAQALAPEGPAVDFVPKSVAAHA